MSRRKLNEKVCQFVEKATEVIADELAKSGAMSGSSELASVEVARAAASAICQAYGGSYIYVPRDVAVLLAARDQEMYAKYALDGPEPFGAGKFTSGRAQELCREYRISVTQFYAIAKLMRQTKKVWTAQRLVLSPGGRRNPHTKTPRAGGLPTGSTFSRHATGNSAAILWPRRGAARRERYTPHTMGSHNGIPTRPRYDFPGLHGQRRESTARPNQPRHVTRAPCGFSPAIGACP
jgi:Mor family transcriptional regulator